MYTMCTVRPIALLIAMVLVLLTACSAPSVNLAPSAPTDTRLVVGFANIGGTGGLEALDINTGKPLWKTQLGGGIVSSPMIEHGVVYAITQDPSYVTRVVAVRESDGKLLWRGPIVGSMTVDESAIAVTETSLHVLDPATGVERWHLTNPVERVVMRHGVIYAIAELMGDASDLIPQSPRTPVPTFDYRQHPLWEQLSWR